MGEILTIIDEQIATDLDRGSYVKGSPRHRKLLTLRMEAKALLVAVEHAYKTIHKFGDLQDNAFYYNGHAAPELMQVAVNLEQYVKERQP